LYGVVRLLVSISVGKRMPSNSAPDRVVQVEASYQPVVVVEEEANVRRWNKWFNNIPKTTSSSVIFCPKMEKSNK